MGILNELFSDPRGTLLVLLLALPGRMLAISAHEAAHAWVADRCGDPTARYLGRVTLNPLKHLDPLGLACMLLIGIGWAKPVPVNPRNFRSYRRDDLLVSLAGITMNLILFCLGILVYYVVLGLSIKGEWAYSLLQDTNAPGYYLFEMLRYFILTNLVLAVFNLIPLPPLDGYHVLNDLVLRRPLFATAQAQRVGYAILIVGMWSGVLSRLLGFVYSGVFNAIEYLVWNIYRALGIM